MILEPNTKKERNNSVDFMFSKGQALVPEKRKRTSAFAGSKRGSIMSSDSNTISGRKMTFQPPPPLPENNSYGRETLMSFR